MLSTQSRFGLEHQLLNIVVECSFCYSDVVLSCVGFVCDHVGFVDYAGDEAVVI